MSGPFEHIGTVYSDIDELIATIMPRIRSALESGNPVWTVVDRRTAALLREALGSDADAVGFRAPSELLRPGPETLVEELRRLARDHRPQHPLLVGQYQGFTTSEDAAFWEAACSLVLEDLPLTLLCACLQGADARAVQVARTSHPTLLTGAGAQPNPEFRPPLDRSPTPASMWGRRALRLTFQGPADLGRVRERVARVAVSAGLGSEQISAAVLAVHEAALLACGGREGSVPSELEIRVIGQTVLTEVRGPGPVPFPAPLRYVELFSDAATLRAEGEGHAVRVLSRAGSGQVGSSQAGSGQVGHGACTGEARVARPSDGLSAG